MHKYKYAYTWGYQTCWNSNQINKSHYNTLKLILTGLCEDMFELKWHNLKVPVRMAEKISLMQVQAIHVGFYPFIHSVSHSYSLNLRLIIHARLSIYPFIHLFSFILRSRILFVSHSPQIRLCRRLGTEKPLLTDLINCC